MPVLEVVKRPKCVYPCVPYAAFWCGFPFEREYERLLDQLARTVRRWDWVGAYSVYRRVGPLRTGDSFMGVRSAYHGGSRIRATEPPQSAVFGGGKLRR